MKDAEFGFAEINSVGIKTSIFNTQAGNPILLVPPNAIIIIILTLKKHGRGSEGLTSSGEDNMAAISLSSSSGKQRCATMLTLQGELMPIKLF